MLSHCPHCQQDLGINAAQQDKITAALSALAPGKTLKIACPKCRQAIELAADGSLVAQAPKSPPPSTAESQARPEPPRPPDLSWLSSGGFDQQELVEDVPQALIAIGNEEIRAKVESAFTGMGYQLLRVRSADEALEKMRFTNFEAVALHSSFEGGSLDSSLLHQHMRAMAMARRRYIFYVLLGPEFHSLYDLEALANSANLVVNDRELAHFPVMLKKALSDYAALFGPYLEALKHHGVK